MEINCNVCWEKVTLNKKRIKTNCSNCGEEYNINSLPEFEPPKNTKIHKTIGSIWG